MQNFLREIDLLYHSRSQKIKNNVQMIKKTYLAFEKANVFLMYVLN